MSELMKNSVGLILNMFIGDVSEPDIPLSTFILFDKSKAKDFNVLLKWFEGQEAYVYDYAIDDKYHMIVIQVPNAYTESYFAFMNSKYSKMYPKEFLDKYLNTNSTSETYSILAKTETRANYLISMIDADGTTKKEDLADEYDDLIDNNEKFNKLTYQW